MIEQIFLSAQVTRNVFIGIKLQVFLNTLRKLGNIRKISKLCRISAQFIYSAFKILEKD